MLIAILILLITSLILNIVVLSGFWDMYQRIRSIETGVNQLRSAEVSEHLQKLGKMKG